MFRIFVEQTDLISYCFEKHLHVRSHVRNNVDYPIPCLQLRALKAERACDSRKLKSILLASTFCNALYRLELPVPWC
jgi:hypothetical protein